MPETKPDLNIRPLVDGKFLKIGSARFYVKGVTYGTFKPDKNGTCYPTSEIMERDFKMMSERGINSIRTYTVPPLSLLNLAVEYDLKVMIGLAWEQHLTFLDETGNARKIIQNIRDAVEKCKAHPAILCYSIGNEIPASMVRWYGDRKIYWFLKKIFNTIKEVDPGVLVTYVNYPTTEYLNLPFLDFYCYNVYLETKEKLSLYLSRLHNLTGDKPLVMSEIGVDSLRNGTDRQASVLEWQIRSAYEKGCAGTFVFSWTDEWWRGGASIDDWGFGLVDRSRNLKPALSVVQDVYRTIPYSTEKKLPKISVIICSYNGSSTIRDTLDACIKLDYPDYEIIVVNDGSSDTTGEIAGQYDVKLITTENRGLSNARNRGINEATGDIVAFTDDDAWPDPEWLKYLALAYMDSDFGGIGGPNPAPPHDGFISECAANAPGHPVHILTTDEIAEHIPGCNMSFRREVLLEAGGFDPVFRTAGDDVDICWQIQELGYKIGFHPSAFVWHHCRNSFRMYWKQQIGYGKAEALLERKWPERYNKLGHLTWKGYIYGNGLIKPLKTQKRKIYYGSQGSALFQSVYQPATGTLKAIPLMPEWYLLITFLAIVSLLGIEWRPLLYTTPVCIIAVFIVVFQVAESVNQVCFDRNHSRIKRFGLWMTTALLHLIQPLARLKGRVNNGLTLWKYWFVHLNHAYKLFRIPRIITHWSEKWRPSAEWLSEIQSRLKSMNNKVEPGGEFDRWDIENQAGLFASVKSILTIEEYGMGKQMLKLRKRIILPLYGTITLAALVSLSVLALMSKAYFSFSLFSMTSLLLALKILADISGSVYSLWSVVQNLPSGTKEN